VQHDHERDDHAEAGRLRAERPAEPEEHALLVLLDDLQREGDAPQDRRRHDDADGDQYARGDTPFAVRVVSFTSVASRVRLVA